MPRKQMNPQASRNKNPKSQAVSDAAQNCGVVRPIGLSAPQLAEIAQKIAQHQAGFANAVLVAESASGTGDRLDCTSALTPLLEMELRAEVNGLIVADDGAKPRSRCCSCCKPRKVGAKSAVAKICRCDPT